jgi:hypothetical protein
MKLTKLFQVVDAERDNKVWKTYRTEAECEKFMSNNDLDDYMSDLTLTIRPVWTNKSESSIKKMLKE